MTLKAAHEVLHDVKETYKVQRAIHAKKFWEKKPIDVRAVTSNTSLFNKEEEEEIERKNKERDA